METPAPARRAAVQKMEVLTALPAVLETEESKQPYSQPVLSQRPKTICIADTYIMRRVYFTTRWKRKGYKESKDEGTGEKTKQNAIP